MGTDIHLKIQFRDKETGEWLYGDAYIDKPMDEWASKWSKNGKWSVEYELGNRNYLRFAILGNVRNGFGFAGVYTHEPLPSISNQRGIPKDVEHKDYDFGDHSFSWVSLRELMEYDYNIPMDREGVRGRNILVSPEDNIVPETTHVQAAGSVPLTKALGEAWFWCIEALLLEAEKRGIGPDDVRLVFGFDS